MKVRNSLRSLKNQPGSQIVRRRGHVYVINKKNPRFKLGRADPGTLVGPPDPIGWPHQCVHDDTPRQGGRTRRHRTTPRPGVGQWSECSSRHCACQAAPMIPARLKSLAGTIGVSRSRCLKNFSWSLLTPPPTTKRSGEKSISTTS